MHKSSLSTSLMFHAAVLIIGTISLPWLKRDFEIPPSVMVEFVDISKVTETTKVTPQPQKDKKKEEAKPDKPPPVAKNTSSAPVKPVDKKQDDTKKDDKKKDDKVLVDPNAAPDKKKNKDEEKKKETTKAEEKPQRDFSSVLKNLADTQDAPPVKAETPDLKLDESAPTQGANAPLGQKMTMSEEDALRRQLEQCWSVPLGARDAENLKVEVFMVINPDRTLREARVVDTGRYNSDTFFRAAADSAMRAVRNPLCSPFMLPPDKYDVWKTTTVVFDPSQMF